jgi:hypothetical protein
MFDSRVLDRREISGREREHQPEHWACRLGQLLPDVVPVQQLGLVTPAGALERAQTHSKSALFKGVQGKITFAGSSRKGQAYKFLVEPAQPVKVRGPYGEYTIDKLVRFVNVHGRGETAQPAGNSSWRYIPRQ